MKKILNVLLALMLVLSLAACKKNEGGKDPEPEKEDNRIAIILQEGGLGDQGYNDGAKVGADEMEKKYGTKATLVEAVAAAEADTFIRTLADQGYPLIICLDWTIIQQVKDASKDYPNQFFVVLGKSLPGPGSQENLIEPYTALHERGYLMGLLSVLFAKDGNEIRADYAKPGCKVAIMTAGQSVNHNRNTAAYQQAKHDFAPEAEIFNDTTSAKTDSALNYTIAESLIKNQGIEVIWPNIGTGSIGVYNACEANKTFALGIDINQDNLNPGTILSSGRHDTTYMVIDMVERWKAGKLKGTDSIYWGLQTGVVGITDMETIKKFVDADKMENFNRVKKVIDETVAKIESGEYVVYNYFVEMNRLGRSSDQPYLFDDWQADHPGEDYSTWYNAQK